MPYRFWNLVRTTASIAMLAVLSPSVAAQPVQGQKFGDWAAKCEIPQGASKQRCFIFQKLVAKQNRRELMLIAVSVPEKQKARVTLNVPLGVFLPSGLQLNVEGADPLKIALQICLANGCKAAALLPEPLVKAMKSADAGRLLMLNSQRRQVALPISLKGFSAGLAALAQN